MMALEAVKIVSEKPTTLPVFNSCGLGRGGADFG